MPYLAVNVCELIDSFFLQSFFSPLENSENCSDVLYETRTDLTLEYELQWSRGFLAIFQIEDAPDRIHSNDRAAIKQEIVGLMLKSPEHIQKQVALRDTRCVSFLQLYIEITKNYSFSALDAYVFFSYI